MELDIIILPKGGNEDQGQAEFKKKVVNVFKRIYDNVQKSSFQLTINCKK